MRIHTVCIFNYAYLLSQYRVGSGLVRYDMERGCLRTARICTLEYMYVALGRWPIRPARRVTGGITLHSQTRYPAIAATTAPPPSPPSHHHHRRHCHHRHHHHHHYHHHYHHHNGAALAVSTQKGQAIMPPPPRCFLDISFDMHEIGRITIELFPDRAPTACEK